MNINTRTGQFENDNRGSLTVTTDPLNLSGFAKIVSLKEFTVTNDVASIDPETTATFTGTVTGVSLSKGYVIGCECNDNTVMTGGNLQVDAYVSGSDQITVQITNNLPAGGTPRNIPSATWRVLVLLTA